jgi:GTPase SAR1 family protein
MQDTKYANAIKVKVVGQQGVGKSEVVKILLPENRRDGNYATYQVNGRDEIVVVAESRTANDSVTKQFIRDSNIFLIVVDLAREDGVQISNWI